MRIETMQDLFVDELRALFSAETEAVAAYPALTQAVQSPELKQAMEQHLEQTRGQVARLEQVFEHLGQKPAGKINHALRGLVQDAEALVKSGSPSPVLDAGLLCAAQKIEHLEIAGYGSAVEHAQLLDDKEAARLLKQTLAEEKATDKILSDLAKTVINPAAAAAAA